MSKIDVKKRYLLTHAVCCTFPFDSCVIPTPIMLLELELPWYVYVYVYEYKIRLHPFGYARNNITEPKSTVIRVRPLIHKVEILDRNFTNGFNGHNGDGSTWGALGALGGATDNAVSSAGGGRALRITGMGLIHWGAPTRVTLGNGLIGLNGGNGLRCDVVDSLTTPNKWKLVFRQTAGLNTDPSEGAMASTYVLDPSYYIPFIHLYYYIHT